MEITFFTFQAYVSHTTLAPLGWNHPHKERVHDCSHVGRNQMYFSQETMGNKSFICFMSEERRLGFVCATVSP